MEQNYQEVPNIISCKDLDYISDMFNWNYGAYKSASNSIENVQDPELKDLLSRASSEFYNNMTEVLNILGNGGNDE